MSASGASAPEPASGEGTRIDGVAKGGYVAVARTSLAKAKNGKKS